MIVLGGDSDVFVFWNGNLWCSLSSKWCRKERHYDMIRSISNLLILRKHGITLILMGNSWLFPFCWLIVTYKERTSKKKNLFLSMVVNWICFLRNFWFAFALRRSVFTIILQNEWMPVRCQRHKEPPREYTVIQAPNQPETNKFMSWYEHVRAMNHAYHHSDEMNHTLLTVRSCTTTSWSWSAM